MKQQGLARRIGLGVLLIAVLTACAPSVDIATFGRTFPPHTGDVAVFTDRADVPEGAVEIGQINVVDSWGSGLQASLDAAVARAAELGANAVLLLGQDQSSRTGLVAVPNAFGGSSFVPYTSSSDRLVLLALRIP